MIKMLKRELNVHSFTPESHRCYYEYYALDDGQYLIRVYSYGSNLLQHEITGKSRDKKEARKHAQMCIRGLMRGYKL